MPGETFPFPLLSYYGIFHFLVLSTKSPALKGTLFSLETLADAIEDHSYVVFWTTIGSKDGWAEKCQRTLRTSV